MHPGPDVGNIMHVKMIQFPSAKQRGLCRSNEMAYSSVTIMMVYPEVICLETPAKLSLNVFLLTYVKCLSA